jgi:hypothetical protein
MVGWAKRQKVIDEREDIGLHKEQVELRQLTDAEKAKKLDRDAQESAREASSASPRASQPNLAGVRADIADIESVLVNKLREVYRGSDVLSGVGFEGPSGPTFEVDALVKSKTGLTIFELKYASNRESVPRRIRDGLRQLEKAISLTSAKGCLIIVVGDFARPEWIERWNVQAQQMAEASKLEVKTYVGRRSDFLTLPAKDFVAQLGLSYPESNNNG